jgi:hypothetical protein
MVGDRRLSGCEQTEARFRRDYPWQQCEVAVKRAFCEWLGKRIKSIGKSEFTEYELGYRSMLNGQRTELELEKLQMSWGIFTQEQEKRVNKAEIGAVTGFMATEPIPVITPEHHLARLKSMWGWPKHHQFVRGRVAANPDWGIVIGADGPELAE